MAKIEPRQPQTRVKHEILRQYIPKWGGIILRHAKQKAEEAQSRGRKFERHFVYVDTDAASGRYSMELEDKRAKRDTDNGPIFGSPIIGIQALDNLAVFANTTHGIDLRTNTILIEKDPVRFAELKKSLQMAGYWNRVRETRDFFHLQNGEIAVVCGDSTLMAKQLTNYTQKSFGTFSLYFIDPYGPSGVPLRNFIAPIIRAPHHDCIVYWPYLDIGRKCGFVGRTDLTEDQQRWLQNVNLSYDDTDWQPLVKRMGYNFETEGATQLVIDETLGTGVPLVPTLIKDREHALVRHYQNKLRMVDPMLYVKHIALPCADSDRTCYYLFLTTHNETGALVMNELLWEAELVTVELRQRLKEVSQRPVGQMYLFLPPTEGPQASPRPTSEQIADDIEERLITFGMIQRRELYKALADEPYFDGEVDKALTLLKKRGRISFDASLTHDTWIKSETAG